MMKSWLACLSCDLPPLASPDNGSVSVTILNASLERRQTWQYARLARWHDPAHTHWCTICHLSTDGHSGPQAQTRSSYKEMLSLRIRSPLDKRVGTSEQPNTGGRTGGQMSGCHESAVVHHVTFPADLPAGKAPVSVFSQIKTGCKLLQTFVQLRI